MSELNARGKATVFLFALYTGSDTLVKELAKKWWQALEPQHFLRAVAEAATIFNGNVKERFMQGTEISAEERSIIKYLLKKSDYFGVAAGPVEQLEYQAKAVSLLCNCVQMGQVTAVKALLGKIRFLSTKEKSKFDKTAEIMGEDVSMPLGKEALKAEILARLNLLLLCIHQGCLPGTKFLIPLVCDYISIKEKFNIVGTAILTEEISILGALAENETLIVEAIKYTRNGSPQKNTLPFLPYNHLFDENLWSKFPIFDVMVSPVWNKLPIEMKLGILYLAKDKRLIAKEEEADLLINMLQKEVNFPENQERYLNFQERRQEIENEGDSPSSSYHIRPKRRRR